VGKGREVVKLHVVFHSFVLRHPLPVALSSSFPTLSFHDTTATNMCFDDRDNYTTRVTIRNGHRYTEEYIDPRRGMSWRRRLGLGGSYYPSRYYYQPPQGRYVSGSSRCANYGGYSNYGNSSYYPRGVNYGGYSGYPHGVYDQAGYPRGIVSGGYAGYSSGYGRYQTDTRVAMPRHAVMVSLRSFLLLSRSCLTGLPRSHWLAWHLISCSRYFEFCFCPAAAFTSHLSPPPPPPPPTPQHASSPTRPIARHQQSSRDGGLPQATPPVHLHTPLRPTRLSQLCRPDAQQRARDWRHPQRRVWLRHGSRHGRWRRRWRWLLSCPFLPALIPLLFIPIPLLWRLLLRSFKLLPRVILGLLQRRPLRRPVPAR